MAGLDQDLKTQTLNHGHFGPFKLPVELVLRFRRRKRNWEVDMEDSTLVIAWSEDKIKGLYFRESRSEEGSHWDHQGTINAAFCRNGTVSNHIISLLLANSTIFCSLIQQFSHLGGRLSVYQLDKCGGLEPPRWCHYEGMCWSAPCIHPPSVLPPFKTLQPFPAVMEH